MALVSNEIYTGQGHSFQYVDYVPDFDHNCYRLQFRCENCGSETFEKIKTPTEDHDEHKFHLQDEISDTASRYWKKSVGMHQLCNIKLTDEIHEQTLIGEML